MNRAMSYLQCEEISYRGARALRLEDLFGNFKGVNTASIGAMASPCSWNPEATTDIFPDEKIPMKLPG